MSDLEHYLDNVERTQRADLRIARVAHGAPGVPAERECMRERRGSGFGVGVHVSF